MLKNPKVAIALAIISIICAVIVVVSIFLTIPAGAKVF